MDEAIGASALRPEGRDREHTQRQILEAALEVFSARGFDGASVREIARLSGMNHAMIKYYFENKETLWREAVAYLFQRATEELAVQIDLGDAAVGLEAALREISGAMIGYFSRHPEHSRVVMQESMSPGSRLDWIAAQSRQHHEGLWLLFKEAGLDIELDNPRFIAFIYMITSMCQTPFALSHESRAIYGRALTDPDLIAAYSGLVSAMIPSLSAMLLREESQGGGGGVQVAGLPNGMSIQSSESTGGYRITIDVPAPNDDDA